MNQELFTHLEFGMRLIPGILAIVLACLAKKLVGKRWLIALVAINVVTSIGYWMVAVFMRYLQYPYSYMSKWYAVLGLVGTLWTFCLGMFLFSNYSISRLKMDMNSFLLSFSG